MPEKTYLWFDYETFGLDYTRDRPAQFAAIRTDADFNVIEEPMILYCRPALDYLPEPEAVGVTGIFPQTCMEKGLPEYQFAKAVYEAMTRPGTVHVGYNSAGFDDHVSRFLFWRNFYDAYASETVDECSRYDLFKLVVAAKALRPQGIVWPTHEDGRPSLKLEDLARANGLKHTHAHDALSDVEATIELAKLIREKAPKLFDYAFAQSSKAAVKSLLYAEKPVVWVDAKLGIKQNYTQVYAPIAPVPGASNEVILYNLRYDPETLLQMSASDVETALKATDDGPAKLVLFRINQLPFVTTALHGLHEGHKETLGVSREVAMQRYEAMKSIAPQVAGLWFEAFENRHCDEETDRPKDERLYGGGFPSWADKAVFPKIRACDAATLTDIATSGKALFEDSDFDEMLFRYRARNFPTSLTPEETERWKATCQARLLEGAEGAVTLEAFQEKIEEYAFAHEEEGERVEEICGALYDWCDFVSASID